MALTEISIKNAKPALKTARLFDTGGLYLEISPVGGKWWRVKYRFAGKEQRLSVGVYPDVGLRKARQRRDEIRNLLTDGIDPAAHRKAVKSSVETQAANSFEVVGREWFAKQCPTWADTHAVKQLWMLEKNLYPWIGTRPVSVITPIELLSVLRKVEGRGAVETAKRVKQVAGQVFRFAVATGRAERDPSQDLKGALASPVKKHLAAITDPERVGPLLLALDGYHGTPVVRAALQLAPLVFTRPGELRQARWSEIHWEDAEWRIPAERMKSRQPHIVPLSTQSIEILANLKPLTGRFEWVFPSGQSPRRPMSNNAVLAALRRSGIPTDEMSGHGFRAMARTILDEVLGFRVDWIEHQLAHAVKDANGRAYNRTSHLKDRKRMMQEWANYLDELRLQSAANSHLGLRAAA